MSVALGHTAAGRGPRSRRAEAGGAFRRDKWWRKNQCRFFKKLDFKVTKKAWKVSESNVGHEVPGKGYFCFPKGCFLPCWIELIGHSLLSPCFSCFQKLFRKFFLLEYQNRLFHLELILVSKVRTSCQFSQCGANYSILESTGLKHHFYNTLKSHEYLHLFLKSILST